MTGDISQGIAQSVVTTADLSSAEIALRGDRAHMVIRCHALGVILRAALTHPGSLSSSTLEAIESGIRLEIGQAEACELALAAIAAVSYARPDLLQASILDRLDALLKAHLLPESVGDGVRSTFEFLAVSHVGAQAWLRLVEILQRESLDPGVRKLLLPLLRYYTHWRPDLVNLDAIMTLAESPAFARHRNYVLDYVLERFVFTAPEAFTEETLGRIEEVFHGARRYRYFLDSLMTRPGTRETVKKRIAGSLVNRFPLRPLAASVLKTRPFKLLVILNVRIGQGDEIVRLVPLLEPMLEANSSLSVTLVTGRPYLYDNERALPISILDDQTVESVIEQHFDGVVDIFEPTVPEMAFRAELKARLHRYIAAKRPDLVIRADVGHNHFLYQMVELRGQELARQYGFDRRILENVYEPCIRLHAELGLPHRAAEKPPQTPSLLVGIPSTDAEVVWRDLVGLWGGGGDVGAARRPIALVNAFGGAYPIKGYIESRSHLLAAEVTGLVREGYRVVLLPNGTSWGRRGVLARTLSHLSPKIRRHVVVAPDPAEADTATQIRLAERPDLPYADRIMRLFKYFATYADLVVTVEGWMMHLAYNLGRPFRLVLMPWSSSFDWHPHGRGRNQRLVTGFSPASEAPFAATELLGETDPPPRPHRPRKEMLQSALFGLGLAGGAASVALLLRAMASEDWGVRVSAVGALGWVKPLEKVKAHLLAALKDKEQEVRREAAEALLSGGVDCSRELGTRYVEHILAHREIARHNWSAVARLGMAALPALALAAEDESGYIRRGARHVLGMLMASVQELRGGERL